MNKLILIIVLVFFNQLIYGQFAGPAGTVGSTAIYKDSSIFVGWASGCIINRGYQDISNPPLGYTSVGDSSMALGIAGSNGVVSLGDGGTAIVTFQNPITNGSGFDFAIFENSFSDVFLELAYVEVSSDGINYVRFPSTSNTQTTTQIGPFDNSGDATKINNLAGKYKAMYGTPFDLQELSGNVFLDINAITHIKIIDVVGSINPLYASFDINNNPINDPFPTAFASGGFDLDALGVIHLQNTGLGEQQSSILFQIYPNPISYNQQIKIICNEEIFEVLICNNMSKIIFQGKETSLKNVQLEKGLYFVKIITNKGSAINKIISQ